MADHLRIVKCEILWTRLCPLACSFCAMPRNDIPRAPIDKMIEGVHRLRELGVEFFAIYGASPLYEGEQDLVKFIEQSELIGITTTIITDGIVPRHKDRLRALYDVGLRSLTMSYDFIPYDKWSNAKSRHAIELVNWFATLPNIRDVEIVATVTSQNYRAIIEQLPLLLAANYKLWFSFDFVHWDRGHPGTKVKGQAEDLRMKPEYIREFSEALLQMKLNGGNIHQSFEFLEMIAKRPTMAAGLTWNCAHGKEFPSWLTIDADGAVLPCDDFWTSRDWKVWDLTPETLSTFATWYKTEVKEKCKGCLWSTHWDAAMIKRSGAPIDDYIHQGA